MRMLRARNTPCSETQTWSIVPVKARTPLRCASASEMADTMLNVGASSAEER